MDSQTKPLVSIVSCTYNRKSYLKDAIDSVLQQTYENWEYIIWSDGSSDGTAELVKSIADPRIKFFEADNQGVGPATICATSHAQGKYIAHLDDDDMFLPTKIEKQVDFLESHPDIAVVGCSAYFVDVSGNDIGIAWHYTKPVILKRIMNRGGIPITHSCSMFRKSDYISVGGYPTTKRALDAILWNRLRHAGLFANLPEVLVKYRVHGSSITVFNNNGPYSKLLDAFIRKIFIDEGRNEEDNALYNSLYIKNKEIVSKTDVAKYQQFNLSDTKRSFPYKVFKSVSGILGNRNAVKIFICLHDIIGTLKFRK